jgi:hypothetical protein
MSLRLALGFVRESDPGAWQCPLCHHWRVGSQCYDHKVRVFGPPTTKRPEGPFVMPPSRQAEKETA